MNRKQFLLVLAGGTAATQIACKKESAEDITPPQNPTPTPTPPSNPPPATITFLTANLTTELLAIGDIKQDTVRNAFVQRIAAGNVVTSFKHFSLVCTHQGCTVAHQSASGEFHCPCHGSKFNPDGSVLNGPAPRPMDKFFLYINGNELSLRDR